MIFCRDLNRQLTGRSVLIEYEKIYTGLNRAFRRSDFYVNTYKNSAVLNSADDSSSTGD